MSVGQHFSGCREPMDISNATVAFLLFARSVPSQQLLKEVGLTAAAFPRGHVSTVETPTL